MKTGKIIETIEERYNCKRGWFRKAYRIVDLDGNDLLQPYCKSIKEAREDAKYLNIQLLN